MYTIQETVLVEGVYDKIKLSRFLDGIIYVANGFQIFSNPKALDTIRTLAQKTGLVILTDADAAGFQIRNYVKQALAPLPVLHAYIPEIPGKERRKQKPGKAGLLGVEGISEDLLIRALRSAGCTIDGGCSPRPQGRSVTKADFFTAGLSGQPDSAARRRALCQSLNLPGKISANMLLDVVNRLLDWNEFMQLVQALDHRPPSA